MCLHFVLTVIFPLEFCYTGLTLHSLSLPGRVTFSSHDPIKADAHHRDCLSTRAFSWLLKRSRIKPYAFSLVDSSHWCNFFNH